MTTVTAWIGLGANLDRPFQRVARALAGLGDLPATRCTAASRVWRSPPMGPQDQPEFANAVARVETALGPAELLAALHEQEAAAGRVRAERWGPRTLDLDLLLYADQASDDPALRLPHPGVWDRDFVLHPLAEIDPDLILPGGRPLREQLARVPAGAGLQPVAEEAIHG
ncbi:2-amino-4-hydroxy-6-hydroxymethyldihydropteridine diphosphokinase [Thiohalospira sp.]|uniref:2-amino-4-hydroxy-6- hydroxymethyldihydropteridine diphosphokinase n=1 Tax=Thiohalospira sp. TaxID=3080549 RepID=UPI003980CB86